MTLFVIVGLFGGCAKEDKKSEKVVSEIDAKALKVGDVVTLHGVEGGIKKLKRVKGGFVIEGEEDKVLMIDIFGTFCPPCREEAPNLTQFQINYSDKVQIVGLTFLENVSDEYVRENFSQKYSAHYFIANSKKTPSIVRTIVDDINYPISIQLPFKVVIKNGKYEKLTDVWYKKTDNRFYLGNVGINTIINDMDRVLKSK